MRSLIQAGCLLAVLLTVVGVNAENEFCGNVNADTLQLTIVVFRHGDRTPYKTYPTDPYKADTWAPWGGYGQLTQEGMEQHYLFGQWMRSCYASYLNDTYSPKDLYVRSTDYDRTLMSAESHLAGAYPPHGFQIWAPDQNLSTLWQPIPIHTIPKNEDYLLITDIACPPYQSLVNQAWAHAPKIKEIQIENQALLDYISENAGLPLPGDLNTVSEAMSDSVSIEKAKGFELPKWINSTVQTKLETWKDIWIIVELATDQMVQYAGGQLVAYMQDTLVNKTKGHVSQKHIILSAHDTTVGTLLAVYGDFNRMGPPYRSAVITELHLDKASNRYFVKAFFRNDTTKDPWPLQIRNCGSPCWIDQYVSEIQPLRLDNKMQTCQGSSVVYGLDQNSIIAIASTASVVIVLVIATVIFLMYPVCKRKQDGAEHAHKQLVE